MNDPKKIELLEDYQFNELDNYARIPRGTVFEVLEWQGINGEYCPIVNGNPFVDSSIYFTRSEWKPSATL